MKWLPFLLTASTAVSSTPATLAEVNPARGSETVQQSVQEAPVWLFNHEKVQTQLEEYAEAKAAAAEEAKKIKAAEIERAKSMAATIKQLKKYVGRTPYVFSGITPSGWDCSGLTRWFYQESLGITLEHSAVGQAKLGEVVDAPTPGDIVAFYYAGQKNAYHVGIYIGDNQFIHAPKPSRPTSIDNVYEWANNTEVAFIRY